MTTIALLAMFAGYSVGSYGYVLVRGFNITPRQWFDPLNTVPPDWTPNNVPAGRVYPGSASTASAPSAPATSGAGSSGVGAGIANAALNPPALSSPGVTANPNVGALFPVILPNANGVSQNNLNRLGG